MAHVICTGEPKTQWQPSSKMDTPVDFFSRDQVQAPAGKNARCQPEVEQEIKKDDHHSIYGKQEGDIWRRLTKGNVLCLFGGADVHMMLKMPFSESAARPMQQPTMVRIFECISP